MGDNILVSITDINNQIIHINPESVVAVYKNDSTRNAIVLSTSLGSGYDNSNIIYTYENIQLLLSKCKRKV